MISKNTPPKLAILRNYNTPFKWGQEMLQSWFILIKTFAPDAEIQVFCPVTGGGLPNPDEFDVIILTGGLSDLTIPKPDPWVQDVFDLIEDVAKNHPNTKVLGVCWGHQAIAKALGGSIASNKSAERVCPLSAT
jgi:GMP synthase-like glutamine amidotransferase